MNPYEVNMKFILPIGLIAIAAAAFFALSTRADAQALTDSPYIFSGTVTVDGAAPPDGLTVHARVEDYRSPAVDVVGGKYEGLTVNPSGVHFDTKIITFYLGDSVQAAETEVYRRSGIPVVFVDYELTFPNLPPPNAGAAQAQTNTPTDYDTDDDGLIEVGSLAQLDAIRWDLDGDGSPTDSTAYDAAFPSSVTGMGCPQVVCIGYELVADLDFDTNGDGDADTGDGYWNGGAGWHPIGGNGDGFNAVMDGNGHTVSSLFISRDDSDYVGLFGYTETLSDIKRVGLVWVNVIGKSYVGGLVGINRGTISSSYATGSVDVTAGGADSVASAGGLVGINDGSISSSYATGSVDVTASGDSSGGLAGGLVGFNGYGGIISSSYATGSVDVTASGDSSAVSAGGLVGANVGSISSSYATGSVDASGDSSDVYAGGLVGFNDGSISYSYWDTETSRQSTSAGGEGKTTSELQTPTGYTGIYAAWNVDLDGWRWDEPWDFGTASEYPSLIGVGPVSPAEMDRSAPSLARGTRSPRPVSPAEMDRSALVTLYDATGGDNWTDNTNWLRDEPLGDWHGVTTDADGRVTQLRLANNRLTGELPSQLGDLSSLRQLRLGNNELSGPIPSELGNLSNLGYLYLNANDLTGSIPAELGGLANLVHLYVNDNNLSGSIPSELGGLVNLRRLYAYDNDLSGSIPIELGRLASLERLHISENDLSGSIPSELGDMSSLTQLILSDNDLTGSIPSSLGSLTQLEELHLDSNELSGAIPAELGDLSGLTELYMSDNYLEECIPANLRDVPSNDLDDLGLSGC